MCTSIVSNRRKTIVGWNLDILDMEHRVTVTDSGVLLEIFDETAPDNAASMRVLQKAGFVPTGAVGDEGPRFVWRREI